MIYVTTNKINYFQYYQLFSSVWKEFRGKEKII